MKSIRLLYFTSEPFPTFRADVAGLFGKYLPNRGINSDIVTELDDSVENKQTWGGGKAIVCTSSKFSSLNNIKKFFHCLFVMLKANSSDYDAIQVRDMPLIAVMCLVFAKLKRLNFYYWMSYPIPEGQIIRANVRLARSYNPIHLLLLIRGYLGKWALKWLIFPNVNHLFVQSVQMKSEVISKSNLLAGKVTPVCMGVDLDLMKTLNLTPVEDPFFSDKKVIVYLGTIDKVRQIEVLFEMLFLVRQNIKNAVLVLIGDTKDTVHREWLKEQAIKHQVQDHVLWTGWVPMNDAWRYALAGDVALSPFPRNKMLDSASPTKVPEYIALGMPVVGNDNPDQKEAIEQSGAGICVEYTAKKFADSVEVLLAENEEKRKERMLKGLNYIEQHRDYNIISTKLSDIYKKINHSSIN